MDKHEREDFRLFCHNATDKQLAQIIVDERKRAVRNDYYQQCLELAEAEQRARTHDKKETK